MKSSTPVLQPISVLTGHKDFVRDLSWSPDGRWLASASSDKTVRIWDPEARKPKKLLSGHAGSVVSIAWSPHGLLASGSKDKRIFLWDTVTWKVLDRLAGHTGDINSLSWSPDGRTLASVSDDGTLRLWSGNPLPQGPGEILCERVASLKAVAWSRDGKLLAAGSRDKSVRIWNMESRTIQRELKDHAGPVRSLAWSPDGRWLASGSDDKTIRLWEAATGRTRVRDGHTGAVGALSFAHDSRLLASWATDNTIRLWRCDDLSELASVTAAKSLAWIPGLAFHPEDCRLAVADEKEHCVRIFAVNAESLPDLAPVAAGVAYTTAKIVLVGEGRVGKTSLGCRLDHGVFEECPPTHGQHFWVVPALGIRRGDGAQCEPVLWDLAGQPEYRLVHALYLGDVDLGLIVFDPTQEELKGVDYWLGQLSRTRVRKEPCRTILVGAGIDRGNPAFEKKALEEFARQRGVTGGYVGTSAKRGDGISELVERIQSEIPWDRLETWIPTETFRRVKEYVLELKQQWERQQASRREVLLSLADLRARLEERNPGWEFSDADLMTAVGHAQNHGFVAILRRPDGGHSILLFPELLANLSSSLVQQARQHPHGLGTIEEERLLHGGYELPELERLDPRDREVLLTGVVVRFLESSVCFRETVGGQGLLVFPSLIRQKRPPADGGDVVEGPSYRVRGAVENVYASLAVRIGSSNLFQRAQAWEKQAELVTEQGGICGFRVEEEREGDIVLALYFGRDLGRWKLIFQELFEQFLYDSGLAVTRYPSVVCSKPGCGYQPARAEVVRCVDEGRAFLFCGRCGSKIPLDERVMEARDLLFPEEHKQIVAARKDERAGAVFRRALFQINPKIEPARKNPVCFISYAHGDGIEQLSRIRKLVRSLEDAGVQPKWDRRTPIGQNIRKFMTGGLEESQFVIVFGTPLYVQKSKDGKYYLSLEFDLILTLHKDGKINILPVLLRGDQYDSFPLELGQQKSLDFRDPSSFYSNLFDLLLTLYGVSPDDPALDDLRWEIELVEKEEGADGEAAEVMGKLSAEQTAPPALISM